jgi:phosphoenolpyruvate carboxykinase (ATP)
MLSGIIAESTPHAAVQPVYQLGLSACQTIFLNLSPSRLIEHALMHGEGELADSGALMCQTGAFTGRSPKDKFIVYDSVTADTVHWGDINQPFDATAFSWLHAKMLAFLKDKNVYVRYAYAGASRTHRMPLTVVTTQAWQSLFCYNLFIRPTTDELHTFTPEWTVLCIPEFEADPATDGTRQRNFTVIDFTRKMILIGGTAYAGEIKKGIFTVLNFILPLRNILSMHCAANVGAEGDTALFFGLSGTGKTTLSADPERQLIGDDEHGWADTEVFNFEGGCYAKVVNLTPEREPQIYKAIRFGSLLENTRFFPGSKRVNFADQSITENTRVGYPLSYVAGAIEPSVAGLPRNIFFLTADAFGVLPPLARLTPEQAMYHFLSGYTSKLAGTEVGIKEPVTTFSACFGAAFLPLHPMRYARLLGKLLAKYGTRVWLVNTGWTGGPYGVGSRIRLDYTRAMIRAVLNGELNEVEFTRHPVFQLTMPTSCPGVPDSVLNPEQTWNDPDAYQVQARKLQDAFRKNFARLGPEAETELRSIADQIARTTLRSVNSSTYDIYAAR